MKKNFLVSIGVLMIALMISMSAGAANVALGPVPVTMGADVAIASPTSAGTQEYYDGSNVNLYVTATGAGLTYQWSGPLGAIAGATDSGLTLTSVTLADTGAYTCAIGGTCGAPAVTLPVNVVIYDILTGTPLVPIFECPGGTISITATVAGGKAPYAYVWSADYGIGPELLVNGPSPGFGVIAGVGTADLTVTGAGAGDAADYSCDVSDTPLINDSDI